jgi:uncharacterized caspase-like protein
MRAGTFTMGGTSMRLAKPIVVFSLCLFLTSAISASLDPAAAQQQEKRVALVIGNGSYAKAPLATTANDAGLVAQTLQAAGFDVIGARDLDADSLRKTFRDFLQKAESDPANTVAMIYLSGYGIQLAGENYYIPVDSTISRDTDIPIEGLRLSDYTRELASVPLKASVFVLDAARQQPFVEGGNPIASGLALVDPAPNTLIAFNAAPGTVAPTEAGPYGAYAQALAEMIRTGGLTLPDVFDRVRLRVSENTKGGQIPWDAQKIQVPFAFFERAPDAPPVQGSADQVAAIRERPMRDLGAQEAFSAALARDTMQGYEDFLLAYPTDPLAKRVRAIVAARREAITWRRTYLADTPDGYWSYMRRYPQGPHAWDARRRLMILSAALEPPPTFAMIDYDLPPPPPDEMVFVDRPVFYFGDPVFAFAPPPPPPVYFLPPPPPDFVVLAPPIVAVGVGVGIGVGLFVLPRPAFVPIPAFVRPPVYVAPPPNNIIYNNIHNTTVINTVINNPAPAPAAIAAAGGPKTGTLGPTLPNNVAQRASLIQEGKLQAPPSASINAAAKPGTPGVTPANIAPNAALPRANALPVPGAKGAPASPPGATGTLGTTPSAKLTTPTESGKLAPATSGKPTATQGPATSGPQEHERKGNSPPTTTTMAKPDIKPEAKPANTAPRPDLKRANAPPPPPPNQEAKRFTPPPSAPKPAAAPPPPRPATAAVRPAPPPVAPRPAPAAPAAPKPAAAKKCPPNQPRC